MKETIIGSFRASKYSKKRVQIPKMAIFCTIIVMLVMLGFDCVSSKKTDKASENVDSGSKTFQVATTPESLSPQEKDMSGKTVAPDEITSHKKETIETTTEKDEVNSHTIVLTLEEKAIENFRKENITRKYKLLSDALVSKTSVDCGNEYLANEKKDFSNKGLNLEELEKKIVEKNGSDFIRKFPKTDFELRLGTKILAVLETAINSQLPGMITAIVSSNIYDSATGKQLLIPRGSQLVGMYENNIAYGQNRVMVAWNRINFPDASYLDLPAMPGAGLQGQSGFKDKANHHYFRTFSSAAMLSLITAGVNLAIPDGTSENKVRDEVTGELAKNLGQVASDMLRKNMSIAPTIMIRAGHEFNVMVSKDISFEEGYKE